MDLKPIAPAKNWRFVIEGEPHILVVIDSSHADMYYYFWEDAHMVEPWKSGIESASSETLYDLFKIKLED